MDSRKRSLAKALSWRVIALLITALVNQFLLPAHVVPRSVFLIDWGVVIVILGGARAVLRVLQERSWSLRLEVDKVPTLIVGAGHTGELLWRSIMRSGLPYHVVGFVDEDTDAQDALRHPR